MTRPPSLRWTLEGWKRSRLGPPARAVNLSPGFVDDPAAGDGIEDLRLQQVGRPGAPDLHEVSVEDGDVGQHAGGEGSLPVLLEGRPGRSLRVGLDRLLDGQ